MQNRIEAINSKKFIGLKSQMSLINNKTFTLWNSFQKRRNEIQKKNDNLMYSLQVYNINYFKNFNPNNEFTKYALIEVDDFDLIPDGMETFELESGLYAVFNYIGKASKGKKAFDYIFKEWLPNSIYDLDFRPHFEILGEKYKNEDPNSEEEIWIPVKEK